MMNFIKERYKMFEEEQEKRSTSLDEYFELEARTTKDVGYLKILSRSNSPYVKKCVLDNPNTPEKIKEKLRNELKEN